jgi:hypothetical protein
VFIDEEYDGDADEFVADILSKGNIDIGVGVSTPPFDLDEVFVTVWVRGGRSSGPVVGTKYTNLKVFCDLGYAD